MTIEPKLDDFPRQLSQSRGRVSPPSPVRSSKLGWRPVRNGLRGESTSKKRDHEVASSRASARQATTLGSPCWAFSSSAQCSQVGMAQRSQHSESSIMAVSQAPASCHP